MAENKVTIYSYRKVWKVEKKIYSFSNIKLPIPINPFEVISYVAVAVIFILLGKLFPIVNSIPGAFRYIAIPYLLTRYLMRIKLDGKNPFLFLTGCIRYFFLVKGTYLQLFRKHSDRKSEIVSMDWNCSLGMPVRSIQEADSREKEKILLFRKRISAFYEKFAAGRQKAEKKEAREERKKRSYRKAEIQKARQLEEDRKMLGEGGDMVIVYERSRAVDLLKTVAGIMLLLIMLILLALLVVKTAVSL